MSHASSRVWSPRNTERFQSNFQLVKNITRLHCAYSVHLGSEVDFLAVVIESIVFWPCAIDAANCWSVIKRCVFSDCVSDFFLRLFTCERVERGSCLPTRRCGGGGEKDPGFEAKSLRKLLLLGAQDQRLGTEPDQLPGGTTGTSSGDCQETDASMVRACHMPRQPLQPIFRCIFERGRRPGRQRKSWIDNIKDWTSLPTLGLLTMASWRKSWKRISAESSLMSPRRPNQSRDWTELNFYFCFVPTQLAWLTGNQIWSQGSFCLEPSYRPHKMM